LCGEGSRYTFYTGAGPGPVIRVPSDVRPTARSRDQRVPLILERGSMSTQSMPSTDTRANAEPFTATGLMASLTVKDIRRSMAWYHEVVGFTVETQMEREGTLRAVRLSAGQVRILLNQDDGAKGWDRIKGQGLSLTFNTAQNIDDIANGIKARGGSLASEPADMPWGVRMFRLVDPDGYLLSISAPR